MAIDQENSGKGAVVLPICAKDTSACHTRPHTVGSAEPEMSVLAGEEVPAAATDDKQTSTPTSTLNEEGIGCREKPPEYPIKVDAGNGQALGADGKDGEPPRRVSKDDFQLLKVIGMGAFGKVLQASDNVIVTDL